jgi:hypoxanthine phosphoribosyltransferase
MLFVISSSIIVMLFTILRFKMLRHYNVMNITRLCFCYLFLLMIKYQKERELMAETATAATGSIDVYQDIPGRLLEATGMHFQQTVMPEQFGEMAMRVAGEIDADYAKLATREHPLLFLDVLEGGSPWCWAVAQHIKNPTLEISSIGVSSYGKGMQSSGHITVTRSLTPDQVEGKHVVIKDDVYDTGRTSRWLIKYLLARGVASVVPSYAVNKLNDNRQIDIGRKYVGVDLPNDFLLGSGMDLGGKWRQLPGIWQQYDPSENN